MGLMIEVRRKLYMDETSGKPNDGFQRTHRVISRIIERVASLSPDL